LPKRKQKPFLQEHSLSLAAIGILALWILLYWHADPKTHVGSFFGNAIADWSGVVLTVIGTKYLYERGSAESRAPKPHPLFGPIQNFFYQHSLSFFLIATGVVWVVIYARMDSEAKWGQVVGNIVSEWGQTLGLVLLTKGLFEQHSKESKGD
jgi:hypothetical protein